MDKVEECCGWVGACLTVCFYLSPVLPFINVLKKKLYFEDAPGVYVTTCYVNTFIWYIYGDMIFSDQIKYSNCIGAGISLCLMIIFLIFELRKYLIDSILNTLILITGTWAVYRALTIIIDDDRIVGKICIGTSIIVYLTPIQIVYRVIKEKNYILIQVKTAWVYLFACATWIVYGILITDFYVVCPHVIGAILSCIQIIVYLNYRKKYPAIGERETNTSIDIETSGIDESKKEDTPIKIDEDSNNVKQKPVKIVSSKNDN